MFFLFVRSKPEESRHVNAGELALIRSDDANQPAAKVRDFGDMGWIDRLIRLKDAAPLVSNNAVLRSWNIWGVTLAYFCMNNVLYGMITWIPKYLKEGRGYDVLSMGLVASSPFIGGFIGAILGGYVSDRIFRGRRKPTMLITALMTAVMMAIVLMVPNNTVLLVTALILTGFFLNIGWSAFTAFAMNATTGKTYPFAIAIINSGGNLGGFFAPIIIGAVLDASGLNYTLAFSYFVVILVVGFGLLLTLTEVRPRPAPSAPALDTAEVAS